MGAAWWPRVTRSSNVRTHQRANGSVPLDPVHRAVLWIRRQLRLACADDHQHQRLFVAVIALAARHARRHRNGVTWTKRPLDPLAVFLHVTGHLSLQHEEDLLD